MHKIMLYKFIPAEYAMYSIKGNYLKLTTIKEANDPYEFKAIRDLEGGITDLITHQNFSESYLVACFSKGFESPTMWSHYAKNHTGFVMGYECLNNNKLIKVKYTDKLSKYKDIDKQKLINHLAKTKYKEWSYEQEFRLLYSKKSKAVYNNCEHYFLDLSNSYDLKLKKIIFGINCDENKYYDDITQISPCLDIFKAYQSCKHFKIKERRL
jgi:hypothetical protein